MNATKSQSRIRCDQPSVTRLVVLLVHLLVVLVSPTARAAPTPETSLSIGHTELEETFGVDSPLGRFSYQAGRGLRVGDTGLVLGGFATAEVERLEGGKSFGGVDGLNLLAFIDPTRFLHLFAELEVGQLATLESGQKGVRAHPKL